MNIDGAMSALHSILPAQPPGGPPPTREPVEAVPSSTPVPPPPGANPDLWAMLNAEEQAFFAEESVRGPLTYQRGTADGAAAPATRGQRIDVRA